jgi:surface protein
MQTNTGLAVESGRYRIELCGDWDGCSDGPEYVGFNNKTCGYAVGPRLRSPVVSDRWTTWSVDVLDFDTKDNSNAVVTIKNEFSQARCTNRYMAAEDAGDGGDGGDGPGEDGDYCDSHRVSLRRGRLLPASIEWTVKPIKNSECVHIVSRDKPYGCLRYLSANADCDRRHLRLAKRDDGSGLQRWKFVRMDKRFRLNSNGVTVECPGVAVGSSFTLGGVTYTRRDRAGLDALIAGTTDEAALETTCTTGISDMSELFSDDQFISKVSNPSTFNPDLSSWDTRAVRDMAYMFSTAAAFNQDISWWNTGAVTNMSYVFCMASAFNQDIGSGNWDTRAVRDMSYMFYDAEAFDQDISSWSMGEVTSMYRMFDRAAAFNNGGQPLAWSDTSKVADMRGMFVNATKFNQDIGSWNTGKVKDMGLMFLNARKFNQDIGSWNTGKVKDMGLMFRGALAFDRDISSWDTGAVANMTQMFNGSIAFNNGGQPLAWSDTSKVPDMTAMFKGAVAFDQDISSWNTGAVTTMTSMFSGASAFNNGGRPLAWSDTSKVEDMLAMFTNAVAFDQDISSWNTGAVKSMAFMFYGASAFNNGGQPLAWSDTSKVTLTDYMFAGATSFNQEISSWNMGAVTNFGGMFLNATAFDRDISSWSTGAVMTMGGMFEGATAFNNGGQPLAWSDTSKVTTMASMFKNAVAFNQNIASWNANISSSQCTDFAAGATTWLAAYGGSIASTPPLNAAMAAACGP